MYHFIIEYWKNITNEMKTESGLIGASTYSEAIQKIVQIYNDENIYSIKLNVLGDLLEEEDIFDIFNNELTD